MRLRGLFAAALLALAACGGSVNGVGNDGCTGHCADTPQRLLVADVQKILAQAIAEARARNAPATIAVVDRVGNVLAVFRMTGAPTAVNISSGTGATGGLENVSVIPDFLAAIAKAITGAYLSSEGNAFSTRTASQIVQEHFDPGEQFQPGGPLFGVQFSQLPCSDLNRRFTSQRPAAGPQRSPLGLSADPGGLPLYKNGTPVGAIGVISDGVYGLDLDITNRDVANDEVIALAGTAGYDAPLDRRADQITVNGLSLRYSDAQPSDWLSNPAAAPAFATLDGSAGTRLTVPGYTANNAIVAGTAFGQPESGIRPATDPAFAGLDAFVLVDDADHERFAARAATDGATLGAQMLGADDVRTILKNAIATVNRMRAQIRRPVSSQARVTVSVVDTNGSVLGILRARDAPVFGIDVSLQKARTAAFFSGSNAAADLQAAPDAVYLANGEHSSIGAYVAAVRQFLNLPTALGDGAVAFTDRAGGNLSRPFFPDGVNPNAPGPFSKPPGKWSIFSVGLQLDLVYNAVIQHVVFELGGGADVGSGACTALPPTSTGGTRLANGIQIFPGSVPIYRGSTLVGGIGISGDGVDQDDMVAFYGLYQAGLAAGGAFANAPVAMRADQLAPQGVHLRYVECPQSPFIDSDEQNVCSGK